MAVPLLSPQEDFLCILARARSYEYIGFCEQSNYHKSHSSLNISYSAPLRKGWKAYVGKQVVASKIIASSSNTHVTPALLYLDLLSQPSKYKQHHFFPFAASSACLILTLAARLPPSFGP